MYSTEQLNEKLIFEYSNPMTLVSEMNKLEHWTKKYKRKQLQQKQIRYAFLTFAENLELPIKIILCRMYPRLLDDDNLVASFKYVRDEVAECVINLSATSPEHFTKKKPKGCADSDPRLYWEYKQEKSKLKGLKIQIYQL